MSHCTGFTQDLEKEEVCWRLTNNGKQEMSHRVDTSLKMFFFVLSSSDFKKVKLLILLSKCFEPWNVKIEELKETFQTWIQVYAIWHPQSVLVLPCSHVLLCSCRTFAESPSVSTGNTELLQISPGRQRLSGLERLLYRSALLPPVMPLDALFNLLMETAGMPVMR